MMAPGGTTEPGRRLPVRRLLILTLVLLIPAGLLAQQELFWEFPREIGVSGGRFPEMVETDDGLALVWQEFQGEPGTLEAAISLRVRFSPDGLDWSDSPITIADGIPYLWLEEVPLFSAAADSDGRLVVAVNRGPEGLPRFVDNVLVPDPEEGVAIYRQGRTDRRRFERMTLLASSADTADTNVAPRMQRTADDSLILFLTRRTPISGGRNSSTLTIFVSYSEDGGSWSEPELFIDPAVDLAPADLRNRAVFEQNFLPHLASRGQTDYVAFQTLRQGPEGQVYQIYTKTRTAGGSWSPALPVTESILSGVEGRRDPLEWDNQRPHLGITADSEVLLTFERRYQRDPSDIYAIALGRDGAPAQDTIEVVIDDAGSSSYPRSFTVNGSTQVLWFDDTEVKLRGRFGAFNYTTGTSQLDVGDYGQDLRSASFPRFIEFRGDTFIYWQDQSAGRYRTILLSPDLTVATPQVTIRDNVTGQVLVGGRPWNRPSLRFNWAAVEEDSSGIAGHSWLWSREPDRQPSRTVTGDSTRTGRFDTNSITFGTIELDEETAPDDPDGVWYFSVIARDEAGNWSDPVRIVYELDTRPPPPPLVNPPPTDDFGYLTSNSFGFTWEDAEKDAAEDYRWRLDYLGSLEALNSGRIDLSFAEAIGFNDPAAPLPDPIITDRRADFAQTEEASAFWENLDNGVWAFSVASRDRAGNVGLSSTTVVLAQLYVPVTRITLVTARKDDAERTILRITGRGFAVGGRLTTAVIDRDGEAPWDYEYLTADGELAVYSDTSAEVLGIEGMEEGTYFIGVIHPTRGVHLWNRRIRLDAGGNVKFGPFGLYKYESLWEPATRLLRISGNELLLILIGLMVVLSVLIAVFRLFSIVREVRSLEGNARAILSGQPMSAAERKQAAVKLRSEGMKLRTKFTLWFAGLVLITISIIAVVLGFVWIQMERNTLAEGLESQSRLLVETLTTTASTAIRNSERGTLFLLPNRINALPDALWTTVTGPQSFFERGNLLASTGGYEYIWTSNDDDILDKIELPPRLNPSDLQSAESVADEEGLNVLKKAYVPQADGSAVLAPEAGRANRAVLSAILRQANLLPDNPGEGEYRISDDLTPDIELMRNRVEEEVDEAGINQMISALVTLEEDRLELAGEIALELVPDFQRQDYLEAIEAVEAQNREIETLLLEVSNNNFSSFPAFNADSLRSPEIDEFVFYKPVLYRGPLDSDNVNFFRGTVRLAVSIEGVRAQLALVQRQIILNTLYSSIAALVIGILASRLIAAAVVRPISRLVEKVTEIQSTVDKEQLFTFSTEITTRDELGTLGVSIDDMAKGLAQGAREQKELLAGQDIQKTFLTLDQGENKQGNRIKLSTGGDSNTFFKLFGYYEGADVVSGDYFGYRTLDEDHRVLIKLDIAGHGVTAAMIMVQVASLFVDEFRKVRDRVSDGGALVYDLGEFVTGVNDLMNEVQFRGRFAAFNLSVINVRTGEYDMIHAGDNLVNIYNKNTGEFRHESLVVAPAAGQIDSMMIEMQNERIRMENPNAPLIYQPVKGQLERGEIMFLYTDGIEEAHHLLRDENFNEVRYSYFTDEMKKDDDERFVEAGGFKTIFDPEVAESVADGEEQTDEDLDKKDPKWEEFDLVRIDDVINAAMQRKEYVLERRLDLTIGKPLHFDFSSLPSDCESAVLALASVERVFRLVPNPDAGPNARIKVDRRIDDFLKEHFREYDEFFTHRVEEESDIDYVRFSHLESDPQDDDLTLWAFERL